MSYKDGEYLNHIYQADFEESAVDVSALEARIDALETTLTASLVGLQTVVNGLAISSGPTESILIPTTAELSGATDLTFTSATTTNFTASGTSITCNTAGSYTVLSNLPLRTRAAGQGIVSAGKVNGTAVITNSVYSNSNDDVAPSIFSGVFQFAQGDVISITITPSAGNWQMIEGNVHFRLLSIA